jgi:hypothetical protein
MSKNIFLLLSVVLLCSCNDKKSGASLEKTIKIEFINPTSEPITASIFDDEGAILKDTVPPILLL